MGVQLSWQSLHHAGLAATLHRRNLHPRFRSARRTWDVRPYLRAQRRTSGPSAPSSRTSPRVQDCSSHRSELRVTNAWPSVIEARPNRNALRRRQEHTRGDTDSRPARRQVPLAHGSAGTVPTNSGKGSPPTLLGDTIPVGGMPLQSATAQAPAPGEGWRTPGTQGPRS